MDEEQKPYADKKLPNEDKTSTVQENILRYRIALLYHNTIILMFVGDMSQQSISPLLLYLYIQ